MKHRVKTNATSNWSGLSLVELLATLMILSLVATMAIGVAGPIAAGQRRAAAIGAVEQALERARLVATARGGAALIVEMNELHIAPATSNEDDQFPSPIIELPAGWSATLKVNDESAERLLFDAAGRSGNARFELWSESTAAATIEFLGVSGQSRVLGHDLRGSL